MLINQSDRLRMQSDKHKYSDLIAELLVKKGYSTVFFVAGGNIMHLIESFSKKLEMIPVMHEVNAVIATDYFNASKTTKSGKALALVTVGPGVTNTATGIVGAYIDSREVLLIGGQVKSSDLKNSSQRQNGIQEADGIALLNAFTKRAVRLDSPIAIEILESIIDEIESGRPGPVYLEICLDVQAAPFSRVPQALEDVVPTIKVNGISDIDFEHLCVLVEEARRPIFLLGGGVSREVSSECLEIFSELRIPLATTWGGIDRVPASNLLYAGRPNTYGQRWSNIFLQQSDLLIVLGSSLGLQQTGFNTSGFLPLGKIVHLDIDPIVLSNSPFSDKYNIQIDLKGNLKEILLKLSERLSKHEKWPEWLRFKDELKNILPLVELETNNSNGYINPFQFINSISKITTSEHAIVNCSSGGTCTSFMQTFQNQENQIILSSKGLGSMGIGPGGVIGTQIATGKRTLLFDGDGGFIQNSQELGVISARNLPIKMFIFSNDGYASIRTTQKKYFSGNYVGCDSETGLGFPDLALYSAAFRINFLRLTVDIDWKIVEEIINDEKPWLIEIPVDPEQEFLPKINSRITETGTMESNPLHIMWPDIVDEVSSIVFRYL